jgi:hypothetical protein
MEKIQEKVRTVTFVIEADIQGAFDNGDFDKLISIKKK